MTPAEINAVIAEHDRIHGPPGRAAAEQREREFAQERQQSRQRQIAEVNKSENQALTDAQWDSWFLQKLNDALLDKENCAFIGSVGQVISETRAALRKDYEAKIAKLESRLKELEHKAELNQ
jgi:hypothetical protein